MATDEAVAIARLQKPSELSIRRRPEHEIAGDLDACFRRAAKCGTPLRAGTDHKLNFIREGEWLFEENVGVPFANAFTEHRTGANFDFQPIFDWCELNGGGGAKAKRARQAPIAGPTISTIALGSFSSARDCIAVKATNERAAKIARVENT
jgi:hypothetical protein